MHYYIKEIIEYSKEEKNLSSLKLNNLFTDIITSTDIPYEEKRKILNKDSKFIIDLKKVIDINPFTISHSLTGEIGNILFDVFKEEINVQQIYDCLASSNSIADYSDDILEVLIKKGANPNQCHIHTILTLSETQLKFILHNKYNTLSANNFIKLLLKENHIKFNDKKCKISKEQLSKIVKDLVKNNQLDYNEIIDGLSPHTLFSAQNDIVEILLKSGNLNPSLYAKKLLQDCNHTTFESFKTKFDLALKYGADINQKNQSENDEHEGSLLEIAVLKLNFEVIDYLLTIPNIDSSISLESYIQSFFECSTIHEASELITRFPKAFDIEKFLELANNHGLSDIKINMILDLYILSHSLYKVKQFQDWSKFDQLERSILDQNYKCLEIEKYLNANLKNTMGFKPLHLAVFAGEYNLARQLIEVGVDPLQTNHNGVTILHYINSENDHEDSEQEKLDKNKLLFIILNKINNIDIELFQGETIVDTLIENKNIRDEVLTKTNDPLFLLLKNGTNVIPDDGQTHIAITHGKEFFSTEIWSTARLLIKEHGNLQFHLVDNDIMNNSTAKLYHNIDGWINPGGGDSYPSHPFTKEEYEPKFDIEKAYKSSLEVTQKYNIPSIGMCAGAQQLSLYHGGKIAKVSGYLGGNHTATFIPGTIGHFLLLNPEQKNVALVNCTLPKIDFKISTAHSFAAVPENIGFNMQLGATSEEGVPMSYCNLNNGIRCATQFHPENFYHIGHTKQNYNYQKNWLDSFVQIAKYNNEAKNNQQKTSVKEYLFQVSKTLKSCTNQNFELEQSIPGYNSIDQITEKIFGSDNNSEFDNC